MGHIVANKGAARRKGFSLVELLTSIIIIGVLVSVVYTVFILNWKALEDYSIRAGLWQDMDQIIDRITVDAREATTITVSADGKSVSMFDKKGILFVTYDFLSGTKTGTCQVTRGAQVITLTHNLDFALSSFSKKEDLESLLVNVELKDDVFGRGISIDASTEIFPRNKPMS